jgi:hypothetical protein
MGDPAIEPRPSAPHYELTLLKGSRLLIKASVNGHPVEAVLDSAAELTILDRAFAQTLGLSQGEHQRGQGSGAESYDAETISGVALSAVGLSLRDQTVAVTDLTDISRRLFGRRIDVILGREIFDASRLTIDIEGGWIAVASAADTPPGVRLDLTTEHGVETIPVRVEGRGAARATFDLGNGSGVLISRTFAERRSLLSDGRAVTEEKGGGLGGELARQVLTLRTIEIAGQRFENVAATIDPQPSASDVNVGVGLLRRFMITTDFAAHIVWLDPRR